MVISTPADQRNFHPGSFSSLLLLPPLLFQQRYSVLASLICLYALEYLGYILLVEYI